MMQGWNEGIPQAIAYIEENLTEPISMQEIAKKACVSSFYFQKIFHALCGLTVGEYIRSRRLTLAAQELCATDSKVIDVAMKYGYDSPDSFARAFTKFHGINPSQAKEQGSTLQSFAPLKIKLTLEGGNMLEYKIVEKPQFTLMGVTKRCNAETSYQEIPKFWAEQMGQGKKSELCGMYGVCIDMDEDNSFTYYIADNYIPWKEIPAGCEVRVIPASTWAIFPCRGECPKALQDVNTQIWSEWLPSCKAYKLAGKYNIEMYAPPEEKYSEIWIPVVKL